MPDTIPTIPRTGPIFWAGDYGARGTYTEADLDAMCGEINVPIRMSHHDTILEGKLGTCRRTFVAFDENGKKALHGEWDEPLPLSQLLEDQPRPLSVEIDLATKRISAVALEKNPNFQNAAFFSKEVDRAYAQFSAGEDVTPLTAPIQEQNMPEVIKPEEKPLSFMEKLSAALFGAKPEEIAAAEAAVTFAKTGKTPEVIALEEKLAKFERTEEQKTIDAVTVNAEAKFAKLVEDKRAEPSEKEPIVAAFTAALLADANVESRKGVACFAAGSATADFSLVDHLDAEYAKRAEHKHTQETVGDLDGDKIAAFGQAVTTVTDADGKPVPATKIAELLSQTALGQAVLNAAQEKK